MAVRAILGGVLATGCLVAAFPGWCADPGQGSEWRAASDARLEEMRGGFSVAPGVMVSFGITRTVRIDGLPVSSSGFQVGELRSMTASQAAQLSKQAATLSLVQSGAGNTFLTPLQAASPAIVIQNTLNDRTIQSVTEINAVSNGMSLMKGLNLNQTLNDALGAAVRR
jgi:hypothetical protein